MIVIKNLQFTHGDDPVLNGVKLQVETSQVTVLMGRNGAGKSTLLRHCNGLLEPDDGVIYVGGERVTYDDASLKRLRQRVGLVFQNPDDQLVAPTVRQDIEFGLLNGGIEEPERTERIARTMDRLGLSGYGDRLCTTLSDGEKKRVALAGVLALNPEYVLLDEPTASLDGEGCQAIIDIVRRLVDQGITVLVATHDVGFGLEVADTVTVLEDGRIDYRDDSLSPEVAEHYGLRTFVFESWERFPSTPHK